MLQDAISDLALTIAKDPTPDDLAAHLATVTFHALGAHVVTMYVRMDREEVPSLVLVGHWGLTPDEEAKYSLINEDFPMPAADAFRHVLPTTLTMEQMAARYPLLGIRPDLTSGAQIFLPIVIQTNPVAAVLVTTTRAFAWDPGTWHCAQAVQALLGLYMRTTDRVWLPKRPMSPEFATRQGLSRRQLSVLTLLERGRTIPAISARLGFSESTIKQDLRRAITVLGATNRRDAIARAQEFGLLTEPAGESPLSPA